MLSQGLGRPCGRRRGIMPRWQVPSPAPRARRRRQAATSFLQRVYQGFSETRRGSPSRSMCKCNTLNTYDGGNICRTTQANHASIFARKIYRRPFYIQPVSPWIRSDPIDFLQTLCTLFKLSSRSSLLEGRHWHSISTAWPRLHSNRCSVSPGSDMLQDTAPSAELQVSMPLRLRVQANRKAGKRNQAAHVRSAAAARRRQRGNLSSAHGLADAHSWGHRPCLRSTWSA
jgi:hypothetical protein